MLNLRTGVGKTIYLAWLIPTFLVSLICCLGFAMGSIQAAVFCLLFCTLPLLVAVAVNGSDSKISPVAAIVGSGSMVAFIAFLSLRDVLPDRVFLPPLSFTKSGGGFTFL
jgi:hypothetical protein